MKRLILLAVIGSSLIGCANTDIYSGNVYTADQAKQVQTVNYGTLLAARAVKIQAGQDQNLVGTVGGAVVGGILGNAVGGGTGKSLATAAGVIAGGVAGNAIEGKVNQTNAVEMEIRKDDGETIVVVQKGDINEFKVGQRLRIVSNGSQTTVSPR